MYPIEYYNYWLALGSIALQVGAIVLLALHLLRKRFPDLDDVAAIFRARGLWIAFVLALISSAMTLFYSEVLGLAPCAWCWVQRVFLYAQVALFPLAIWKKDRGFADYSIALSLFGAVVALYQHYLQMGGTSVVPCPATASEALDCGVRFMFEFNYITFPLASFSLFAFLIALMLFVRNAPRTS
ncbi:MAG: hypothetical protein RLZZ416_74 [Candidatus Parcubacteria bacterium]|jgi:disulfide bond formation protein DsbB